MIDNTVAMCVISPVRWGFLLMVVLCFCVCLQLYVDDVVDVVDLEIVARHGMQTVPDAPIKSIVEFYTTARALADESLLDGAGQKPRYSLRTLCRVLRFASHMIPLGTPRSLCFCACMHACSAPPPHPPHIHLALSHIISPQRWCVCAVWCVLFGCCVVPRGRLQSAACAVRKCVHELPHPARRPLRQAPAPSHQVQLHPRSVSLCAEQATSTTWRSQGWQGLRGGGAVLVEARPTTATRPCQTQLQGIRGVCRGAVGAQAHPEPGTRCVEQPPPGVAARSNLEWKDDDGCVRWLGWQGGRPSRRLGGVVCCLCAAEAKPVLGF